MTERKDPDLNPRFLRTIAGIMMVLMTKSGNIIERQEEDGFLLGMLSLECLNMFISNRGYQQGERFKQRMDILKSSVHTRLLLETSCLIF